MSSMDKFSHKNRNRKKRGPGDQEPHINTGFLPENRLLHVLRLQKTIGNQEVVTLLKKNNDQNSGNEQSKSNSGNNTGLPEHIKTGSEELSGISLDGVKVHYNSDKPGEIGAHAFTKGTDIHIAPGQERYLAHETWHVVQQLQGRVKPTLRLHDQVINDDPSLEKEADSMGEKLDHNKSEARSSISPWMQKGGDDDPGESNPGPDFLTDRTQTKKEISTLQRKINITPDMYIRGIGARDEELTPGMLKEYIIIAILDDYKFVWKLARSDKPFRQRIGDLMRTTQTVDISIPDKIAALNQLIPLLNDYIAANKQIYEDPYTEDRRGAAIPIPNRKTRYATFPEKNSGYDHSNVLTGEVEETPWGNDDRMWKSFISNAGENIINEAYETAEPGNTRDNLPLQILPWKDAKRFFPRPLINLLFDIRFQLESDGAVVIDERTPDEKNRKVKSPAAPGTLRSWHQDSEGVLPPNSFAPDTIPDFAHNLHSEYTRNSQSGAGASIRNPVTSPVGYAEYTGTGSNWEHNTKIVLDYITKRVYFSLTHYQYWAIITREGKEGYEFFNGESQQLSVGQDKLRREQGVTSAVWMSPWIEIQMPTA